jgi:hypothetical protein
LRVTFFSSSSYYVTVFPDYHVTVFREDLVIGRNLFSRIRPKPKHTFSSATAGTRAE